VNRYDQRILMSVMADFLMLGAEKVGSFALSSDKTDLFAVALGRGSTASPASSTSTPSRACSGSTACRPDDPPKLCHADIEVPDLADLAAYVAAPSTSGP
jgi:hypothetical protein